MNESLLMKLTLFRRIHLPCLLMLASCGDKSAEVSQTRKPEVVQVKTAAVATVLWDRNVSIVGTLYPKDEALLAAQVEGMIEKTFVEFGERVKAGQILASIDNATYEALLEEKKGNLARATATLDNAKLNLERSTRLSNTGAVSATELDTTKALVAQWEAESRAARGTESVARLNLEHSSVKAPFDGAISQRIVGRGDYVKIGSPLFSVVNDRVLKFIFQVPERFASLVTKDLPVVFTVDNYPGETFKGSVFLISPTVNMSTRSFNVGALVPNDELRLKASSFARGSLIIERSVPVLVVPLDAVVNFAGLTKVFIAEGEEAKSRTVKLGRVQNGKQEITEGLKEGEAVIVSGQGRLTDGAAITIQKEQPSA